MDSSSLDAIGETFNTDKSHVKHDYLRFYQMHLADWQHEKIKFVELGINEGGSIRTWETWFSNADIVGVDFREKWVNLEFDRARTVLGDCGDRKFLREFSAKERPFVLLDDASHSWSHQIACFEECFDNVIPGGFFIMEDLNCSFGNLRREPFSDQWTDAFTYFSRLNTYVCGKGQDHPLRRAMPESKRARELSVWVDWMCFYRSTVVIKKREKEFSLK
ncbi:MAG: hypothetical protein AAGK37_17500 [Pseudomonadota bacterium]